MDAYRLYERCVQSPQHLADFLEALHGSEPRRLREDFSGTGALARHWCATRPGSSAVVVDLDGNALEACRGVPGIQVRCADVLDQSDTDAADVIFVGNFSIGYIHSRKALDDYFVASRRRCADGGVFVCDTYGGPGAFRLGGLQRRFDCDGGDVLHYYWAHESADPITAMVENSVSFRIERAGEIIEEFRRAFTYRWRLWSIPELRESMLDAGFSTVSVHEDVTVRGGAINAVEGAAQLGEDWTVLVCAR